MKIDFFWTIEKEHLLNLINRKQEAQVYKEIKKYGICDNIIYKIRKVNIIKYILL